MLMSLARTRAMQARGAMLFLVPLVHGRQHRLGLVDRELRDRRR